jgi:hypothetical protein
MIRILFSFLLLLVDVAHADIAGTFLLVETKLPTHGTLAGSGLTFTPDGTAVLYYDGNGIATWDIAQRKTISSIPTEDRRFMLSHDGTRIANEAKQSIRLHDAKSGKLLHELPAPPTDRHPPKGGSGLLFRALGFGEESRRFFSANPDDVQVWDVATGKMLGRIAPNKGKPGNAPPVHNRTAGAGSPSNTLKVARHRFWAEVNGTGRTGPIN